MNYTQLQDANWRIPYVGGWCLKYVQDAFGTDHPYASATDAWDANYGGGNHPGELPPAGRTVPVYFSLGDVAAGHVAICMDDGTIASSTQSGSHAEGFIHPNLQNLIDVYGKYNGGCTYLGWSEYVGTVRVVHPEQEVVNQAPQGGEDMIDQPTLTNLYQLILGRDPDDGGVAHYVGHYSTSFVVSDLLASDEHAQHVASVAAQFKLLQDQVSSLQSQDDADDAAKAALSKTVDDLTAQLTSSNAEDANLKLKLSAAAVPTSNVPQPPVSAPAGSGFVDWLKKFFKVPK